MFRAAVHAELSGVAPQPLFLLDTAARAVALQLDERGPGTGGVDLQRLPPDLQQQVMRDIFTLSYYRRRRAATTLPSETQLAAAWRAKRQQLLRCVAQRAHGASAAEAPLPSRRDEALLQRWVGELAAGKPLCALRSHELECEEEFGRDAEDYEDREGPPSQCHHETGVWATLDRMMQVR